MQANITMAENNNKRKSKRNFSLEKPVERRFDIEKEVEVVSNTPAKPDTEKQGPTKVPPIPPVPEKKSNTGKIVGGIAAAAAILAGVYFFGIKGDDDAVDNGGAPTEQIAQAGETAQPEAAQQANATEDATPGEEATSNNESETPAPAEANETPAVKPAQPAQSAQPKQNSNATTNTSTSSAPVSGDIVENAKRVIRGDFGNGQERKDKLGDQYAEIQSKVNEMYRNGLVE